MEIKFIAIDDEPPALAIINKYAGQYKDLRLVKTFDDAITAATWLRHYPVDLIFLDIQMPDLNGIELARIIGKGPKIIFTTAYKQYAYDGFELNAVDYLLKPFSMERFEKAIEKVFALSSQQQELPAENYLVVHSSYQVVRIRLDRIRYIESRKDYLQIHLHDGPPVWTLMTMKKVVECLPAEQFSRIHRSYVVPVNGVRSVSNRRVKLNCGIILPVGDSYHEFLKAWKQP
ncbi:LytTR family DNA-binding domain-containing protein [Chitinophaga sp. sic0106]|uniref:LytR/AlgR family response regulator transcription factor n=1 Tax=Chitinophaga sp. sic0106 TaxID=2854785 RepID=UPI001C45D4C0|nr:response regulator transcription factor [Chitinophaga sp. sic0106]MBV7529313.1 response regulator transcription factor [Chitinophaga sp. sic0106]